MLGACDQDKDAGRPSAVVGTPPSEVPEGASPAASELTPPQLQERYASWRARFEAEPELARSEAFTEAEADLRRIANEAEDAAMRANAALMLGAMYEARAELDKAIDFYRHAAKLVPDDAGPKMALALALVAKKDYAAAAKVQAEAAALDPDNLENWLALAEMQVRSGDDEAAKQSYIDYERRRKGLIDGLTLKSGETYRASTEERVGCARALASAADQGTGIALVYALKSDPSPEVRATVAEVMGIQRLTMYRQVLKAALAGQTDPALAEAATWALAEIERDPVEATPSGSPPEGPPPSHPATPDGVEAGVEPAETADPAR